MPCIMCATLQQFALLACSAKAPCRDCSRTSGPFCSGRHTISTAAQRSRLVCRLLSDRICNPTHFQHLLCVPHVKAGALAYCRTWTMLCAKHPYRKGSRQIEPLNMSSKERPAFLFSLLHWTFRGAVLGRWAQLSL